MESVWLYLLPAVVLIMLAVYGAEDLKKRSISLKYLICFGIIGIALQYLQREQSLVSILLGAAVGGALIVLSIMTRGSIGMGDGFLFLVTGLFLGAEENMELLFISLLYAAVFSLGIFFFGAWKRKKEIPLVPFMFLAYLTMVVKTAVVQG